MFGVSRRARTALTILIGRLVSSLALADTGRWIAFGILRRALVVSRSGGLADKVD